MYGRVGGDPAEASTGSRCHGAQIDVAAGDGSCAGDIPGDVGGDRTDTASQHSTQCVRFDVGAQFPGQALAGLLGQGSGDCARDASDHSRGADRVPVDAALTMAFGNLDALSGNVRTCDECRADHRLRADLHGKL
ncbi:hypothetical protein [Nocardia sp. NPDC047654]|uniref:hypothetical protein n=1 Tax=Nocardia sp. NPDC047654 TaxID=3364314 RepID=UPI003721527C